MSQPLPPSQYDSWIGGVVTSMRADALPPVASPRGRNSALLSVGLQSAKVGKRRGPAVLVNAANAMGSITPAPITQATIHSQHAYRRLVGGLYTYTHLAVQKETGDLYEVDTAGTTTLLEAGAFAGANAAPGWATMKDIAFGIASSSRKKVLEIGGTLTVQNLGLVRPPAAGVGTFNWGAAAGGAGSMSGDYEFALTFYNEHADLESSLSDATTVASLSNQTVTITWSTPPDTQITHVRVHVRKIAPAVLNEDFLWVQAGSDYVAGKGVPVAEGATTLDLTNDAILAFTLSPDTVENNPPATHPDTGASLDTLLGGIVHGSRLLLWSPTGIYYSRFDRPEQFDPEFFEPINPGDGQEIVACHKVNDDVVVIFKRGAMYGLFGNDPNSWDIRLIDPSVGCVAPGSIVTVEGRTYWWSELGPMVWDHAGAPVQLGFRLLATAADASATNVARWPQIVAHVDPPRQQVVFWVPEAGSTENNIGLPFNYQLGVWESDAWDPLDVASAVTGEDANGEPVVVLGGYYGRLYHWWRADVDGARTINDALATLDTTGTVHAVNGTTVTCAGTVTLGSAMATHLIDFYDVDGRMERRRIASVVPSASPDSAEIVLTDALPGDFTPISWLVDRSFDLAGTITAASTVSATTRVEVDGAVFDSDLKAHTYAYINLSDGSSIRRRIVDVGLNGNAAYVDLYPVIPIEPSAVVGLELTLAAPHFEWDTKEEVGPSRFWKKRYGFVYMAGACSEGRTEAFLDVFINDATAPSRQFTLDVSTAGAIWDVDVFDVAVFGGDATSMLKRNVGRVAHSIRLRVRHREPNRQFVLLTLMQESALLGHRR